MSDISYKNLPKKLLIIRFGAIGDVVHSSIIQKAVKSFHPEVEIHFMCASFIAPLLKNDENLSKVYAFDMSKKDDWGYLLKLGLELRKEKYDVVINLQNSPRNSFLNFMSGAKCVKRGSRSLNHATDAFFESAEKIFPDIEKPESLKLFLDEKILTDMKKLIRDLSSPIVVISPAGDNDKFRKGRIWPYEYWNELGKLLKEKYSASVVVAGSKSEAPIHKEFIKIEGAKILSGELTLEESVHLFSLADLFISGDSGPLHIASALDIETLGIYGSTSEVFCAPYGEKGHVIASSADCRPCSGKKCLEQECPYTPCMTKINPKMVFEFIEKNNLIKYPQNKGIVEN